MKHVVSVSTGASSRDTDQTIDLLGERVHIERRGTDGDLKRAAEIIRALDGKVGAFGLGGMDLYVYAGGKRYPIRDAQRLAKHAKVTPIVCGAGLKNTLERIVVENLDERIRWRGKRVLMVSAVDRFGMAEALDAAGADALYGDAIFALGLPWPIRNLGALRRAARLLLPGVLALPIGWIYPQGEQQERSASQSHSRYFRWAEVVAGDWHYIRRYAASLTGKTVLTNTTTPDNVEWARARGATRLITTTPRFGGRSLPTNLLEAAFVALAGYPLTPDDYRTLIARAGLGPNVVDLASSAPDSLELAQTPV